MRRFLTAALVSWLVLASPACDSPTVPPPDAQYNFMNGPETLPQVLRFGERYALGIIDPNTGLRVIAGLPANPASHIGCQVFGPPFNGTEDFQVQSHQVIGTEPPFVQILNTVDVNLHVYQNSTFNGFCRSTVYAQGTGKMVGTDNDLTASGERWNIWGWHMSGDVIVTATGETARLNAFNRFRANSSSTEPVELLIRRVELN
ncbi:MAG TPA: hypothetical protein VFY80_08185 [Burkholderiales bacterium]|nr:hypothetical protein [Burkholderiales bacterium]